MTPKSGKRFSDRIGAGRENAAPRASRPLTGLDDEFGIASGLAAKPLVGDDQGRARRQQFANAVDRFLREARSAAQLKHPGIVLLYGTGRAETGIYYLVQEFVQGGTLASRLKGERLEFRRAAELADAG